MKKSEALELLHTALWSLADHRQMADAWAVEDIYTKFDRYSREERITLAGWFRDRMSKAACIYPASSRRVFCFLIWVLESAEDP